jgi:hypothetical protein
MSLFELELDAGSISLCETDRFRVTSADRLLAASVVFLTAPPKIRFTTLK